MKLLPRVFFYFAFSVLASALAVRRANAQNESEEETSAASFPYPIPAGLPVPPVPKHNPVTKAKVELGRVLFFDGRLSKGGRVGCATCHDPRHGWSDRKPVSTGIHGRRGTRHAPSILNAAISGLLFWDGRASSLEEQVLVPMQNPVEMGNTLAGVVKTVGGIKGYRPYFKAAFGDSQVTIDRIVQAIASFERTLLAGNTDYDRYQAGNANALNASAQRGLGLFFSTKANCDVCHTGPDFSDDQFHNLGVGMDKPHPDLGRYAITKNNDDLGAFKTPRLRGISYRSPYMHDGSERSLEAVVDFYDRGGIPNPHSDKDIHPLHLTAQQKKDLIAFLMSLSGEPVIVEPPKIFPR